jgi:hypothetical protein
MIHVNMLGLPFEFKIIFFQWASLIVSSQKNSQTLKMPQQRISIQSKVFKIKVLTPNIKSYKSKYLPNLYRFQKDNGEQNIWNKMRLLEIL